MGHRDLLVTQNLPQPTSNQRPVTSRVASAARAALFKRRYRNVALYPPIATVSPQRDNQLIGLEQCVSESAGSPTSPKIAPLAPQSRRAGSDESKGRVGVGSCGEAQLGGAVPFLSGAYLR